jgi:hypothetical protein
VNVSASCANGEVTAQARTDSTGTFGFALTAEPEVIREGGDRQTCQFGITGPGLFLVKIPHVIWFSPSGQLEPLQVVKLSVPAQ